jgi:hypothetical protein
VHGKSLPFTAFLITFDNNRFSTPERILGLKGSTLRRRHCHIHAELTPVSPPTHIPNSGPLRLTPDSTPINFDYLWSSPVQPGYGFVLLSFYILV